MQFKILYQELVQSAKMIRTLVTGVTQSEAQINPNPESWSILEVRKYNSKVSPRCLSSK